MVKTNVDNFVLGEQLKSELEKINSNFKELFKRLDSHQKSLDLIYNDRDLLKDIYTQGGSIRELILAFDKHNETVTKDVQQEVIEVRNKVEESKEQVKDTVEYHTDKIAEKIEDKKVIQLKKKGIFG